MKVECGLVHKTRVAAVDAVRFLTAASPPILAIWGRGNFRTEIRATNKFVISRNDHVRFPRSELLIPTLRRIGSTVGPALVEDVVNKLSPVGAALWSTQRHHLAALQCTTIEKVVVPFSPIHVDV